MNDYFTTYHFSSALIKGLDRLVEFRHGHSHLSKEGSSRAREREVSLEGKGGYASPVPEMIRPSPRLLLLSQGLVFIGP